MSEPPINPFTGLPASEEELAALDQMGEASGCLSMIYSLKLMILWLPIVLFVAAFIVIAVFIAMNT